MARYVFDTSIISELRPDHPSLVAERLAALPVPQVNWRR